ncbi:hypothetical protein [Absidia glauca]|uniref:HSF-type DNA-binding domain-containing protein n=1 Tax=Absidia glauca TaxID=4829 RepID=A0A163MN47_ABSGL|nr:hypothetical protein [Absidia glauca]
MSRNNESKEKSDHQQQQPSSSSTFSNSDTFSFRVEPTTASIFISKLFGMVNDIVTQDLIGWSSEGDKFCVHDVRKFSQSVLPQYFKHSNWASFVRQLNMYGFHKVNDRLNTPKDQHACEFHHPLFYQSGRNIIRKIRRNSNKTSSTTASTVELDAPPIPPPIPSPTETQQQQQQLSQELISLSLQHIKNYPSLRQGRPMCASLPSEISASSISQQGSHMPISSLLSPNTHIYYGSDTSYYGFDSPIISNGSTSTDNCDITGMTNERSAPSDDISTNPGSQRRNPNTRNDMDTDSTSNYNCKNDKSPSTNTQGNRHMVNNQGDGHNGNMKQKQKSDMSTVDMIYRSFGEHLRRFNKETDSLNLELSQMKLHLKNQASTINSMTDLISFMSGYQGKEAQNRNSASTMTSGDTSQGKLKIRFASTSIPYNALFFFPLDAPESSSNAVNNEEPPSSAINHQEPTQHDVKAPVSHHHHHHHHHYHHRPSLSNGGSVTTSDIEDRAEGSVMDPANEVTSPTKKDHHMHLTLMEWSLFTSSMGTTTSQPDDLTSEPFKAPRKRKRQDD